MKKGIIGLMTACMLFNLVVVSHAQKVEAETTKSFVKVTSNPSDWSGEYLIVYEDGNVAFNGGLTTLDDTSNTISVTIESNEIAYTEALGNATFTTDGSYLKSKSGYYIGNNSNSNALATSTSPKYINTFSLNGDSSAHIVSKGTSVLRYNSASNQNRFRYYKSSSYSGQKAIHLYKLIEVNTGCEHVFGEVETPNETFIVSEATCTSPAIYYKECTLCHSVRNNETYKHGDPKEHNYNNGICIDCGAEDPLTPPSDRVSSLFTTYYNEGSYTKYSVLNTNKLTDAEVAQYFHASADTKYRKTDYTPDGLKMTISDTEGGEYTNESIYKNEGSKVVHTGLGGDYTVNKPSVEDWFVTLKDFVDNPGTNWTYETGIYSHALVATTATKEDELTRMAREFVAPMWLAPNANNWNYVTFTKLTVEEVDNTLVMKLYVDEQDSTKLEPESNNVFSKVTISKGSESLSTLAVFEFGANGNATHVDGDDAGSKLSFNEGNYTLELTGMSKVYKNAYDAAGNSCIKLGTGSVVGSFSFTVPEDVDKVIINVAKYKGNTTKITVNGTEYTISNASDSGQYDAIEVDTSSTKTVYFATVSGSSRCMINSIEYHK